MKEPVVPRSLSYGFVPAEPVMRLVREYCRRQNAESDMKTTRGGYREDKILSAAVLLADRMGVSRDTVYKWLKGRTKMILFDIADRLLVEIDQVPAWHTDPELKDAYQKVNLAYLDTGRVVHGTDNAYNYHGCRCMECRQVKRETMRKYHKRRQLRLALADEPCA